MKKIKFIGVVNGKEYNDLNSYNDAINEAICMGDVLNASTRTEIVDNEPEEIVTTCKPVFLGVVNGVEYKTVEEYNDAITTAINSGVPINAYTSTLSNAEENVMCTKCDDKLEDNTDYFPFFGDNDDFYLNRLVTDDVNKDRIVLDECKEYLNKCYWDIVKNLETFTSEEFEDYTNDIESVLEEIEEDKNNAALVEKQINERMENRAAEILRLNEDQNADSAKMNTILRGYDTIEMFKDYYKKILEDIRDIQRSLKETKVCSANGACPTSEPSDGVAYSNKELKTAMHNFLNKLFN